MKACLILVLVGFAALLFLVVMLGGDSDSPRRGASAELEARTRCRMAVLDHLKAPRSAEFVSVMARETAPGRWTVGGQVDAENSFGAFMRTAYICEVTQAGKEWRVERVEVE